MDKQSGQPAQGHMAGRAVMAHKWRIDPSKDLPPAIIEDTEDGYGVIELQGLTARAVAHATIRAHNKSIEALTAQVATLTAERDALRASNAELVEAHSETNEQIAEIMSLIETGQMENEQIVENLVEIQNRSRAALSRAEGRG